MPVSHILAIDNRNLQGHLVGSKVHDVRADPGPLLCWFPVSRGMQKMQFVTFLPHWDAFDFPWKTRGSLSAELDYPTHIKLHVTEFLEAARERGQVIAGI